MNDPLTQLLHDPARLTALDELGLLDTPADPALTRLTRLAAHSVEAPIALVAILAADRQFFPASLGLPEPWASRRETPLSHSFCQHALLSDAPLVVEDARVHPTFINHRAIADLGIIAYLGIPLRTAAGYPIGSCCVIDTHPRHWTAREVALLEEVAAVVMAEIEGRRSEHARQQAEARLQHQALYDALTGLPNRTLLCDRLTQAIERAKRHADHRYAVLFLDLDRFKVVNDSLGHATGDQLLRTAAQRLAACIRTQDTVARLGGDEFVVLLDGLTEVREAIQVAERIQATLMEPFHLGDQAAYVSASIGITLSTCPAATADAVLRDADTAMYRAKSAGKARYAIFDATMHAQMVERLELETALRQAVEREALVVHYQPIVAEPSGEVLGVEALVRWPHPTRGDIPPTAFIPLAEETGLIIPLGAWVMRTACAQLATWHAAGVAIPWVAVNLSVRQVQHPHLPALIADTLAATGLAPAALHLEITESCLVDPIAETQATLAQVQALGVRIALDDFGMGYSSLRSLQHLPLDTLKIAQPFVDHLPRCAKAAAISAAIITLAKRLGMLVIAEGVEAPEQMAWLVAQQCDAIQGYLVGPPLTAEGVGTLASSVPVPGRSPWLPDL